MITLARGRGAFWAIPLGMAVGCMDLVACAAPTTRGSPVVSSDPPNVSVTPVPTSNAIRFVSLREADSPSAAASGAEIHMVSRHDDIRRLAGRVLPAAAPEWLDSVDFDKDVLLIAGGGRMGSSGFRISVRSIRASGGTLQVLARLAGPGSAPVDFMEMYPYHAVAVSRSDLPVGLRQVHLVDADRNILLAHTKG